MNLQLRIGLSLIVTGVLIFALSNSNIVVFSLGHSGAGTSRSPVYFKPLLVNTTLLPSTIIKINIDAPGLKIYILKFAERAPTMFIKSIDEAEELLKQTDIIASGENNLEIIYRPDKLERANIFLLLINYNASETHYQYSIRRQIPMVPKVSGEQVSKIILIVGAGLMAVGGVRKLIK